MPVPPTTDSVDSTEIAALRAQVADLEAANTMYQLILDSMPQRVFWKDLNSTYLGCNQRFAQDGGQRTTADMIGINDHDPSLPWTAQADLYQAMDRKVMAAGVAEINFDEPQDQPDGSINWVRTSKIPLRNATGAVIGVLCMYEDITAQKQRELDEQRQRDAIIEQQAQTLAEVSTPLLTISDATVVMPLVGAVDSRRVQQMMDTLLSGAAATRARTVILDITGVPVVDTQVANALIQAAQAVKLLGAEVVLTGIRPEVAQTLVQLGVSLTGVTTRGTLQDGIASTLRR